MLHCGRGTSREAEEELGARGQRSGGSPPGLVGEEEEDADRLEKGLEPRDWGAGLVGSELGGAEEAATNQGGRAESADGQTAEEAGAAGCHRPRF